MSDSEGYKRAAVAGSGTIACGLAATASALGPTLLLARSDASAWRAEEQATAACAKIEGADASRLRVTTDAADLGDCDLVVEAIIEDLEVKRRSWSRSAPRLRTPTSPPPPPRFRSASSAAAAAAASASSASTSSTRCRR